MARERQASEYSTYLPKLAFEESGSSSTDNILDKQFDVTTTSSVPSTPLSDVKLGWGHQRTWSTGIIPDRTKPSPSFNSGDSVA